MKYRVHVYIDHRWLGDIVQPDERSAIATATELVAIAPGARATWSRYVGNTANIGRYLKPRVEGEVVHDTDRCSRQVPFAAARLETIVEQQREIPVRS